MRIVSLTCSNTEIVFFLGCAHLLVGIDNHSDYPPEIVRNIPRVGPDLGIDVERVVSLKPDLVLASLTVPGHEKIVERLQSAGLPYVALEPIRLENIYTDIHHVGELLGAEAKAKQCIHRMKKTILSTKSHECNPHSLLIQWWPNPVIAPGKMSWTEDLLDAAGLFNPIGDREVKSTPLTNEEIVDLNPDAIAISWCGVPYRKYRPQVIYRNETWRNTKFVKNECVFKIPEAHLGRPSPRLVDGFAALKRVATQLKSRDST